MSQISFPAAIHFVITECPGHVSKEVTTHHWLGKTSNISLRPKRQQAKGSSKLRLDWKELRFQLTSNQTSVELLIPRSLYVTEGLGRGTEEPNDTPKDGTQKYGGECRVDDRVDC